MQNCRQVYINNEVHVANMICKNYYNTLIKTVVSSY